MIGARPLLLTEVNLVLDRGFEGSYQLRNQTLFILGLWTGFRISELLSLRVADLLNPDHSLKRTITVARRHMKGRRQSRSAILHPDVIPYLQRHINSCLAQDKIYLFQSREREAPVDPSQGWRVLDKAFRKVSVYETRGTHCMRKTFAKTVYEATQDVFKTQIALGHKDIGSTTSYLSFTEAEVHDLIGNLQIN